MSENHISLEDSYKYYYKIFNQVLELPFKTSLLEKTSKSDNTIKFRINKNIKYELDAPKHNVWSLLNKDLGYFYKKGVGLFLCKNPNSIEFNPLMNDINTDEIISALIFSPVAMTLVHQNKLIIHGSAVRLKNQNLIFCGPSGTGKSTLAVNLIDKDARLITEDIICYDPNDDKIAPSYSIIKINKEYINNKIIKKKLFDLNNDRRERSLYKIKSNYFEQSKIKADKIFFISGHGQLNASELNDTGKIFKGLYSNIWKAVPFNSCVKTDVQNLENLGSFINKHNFYEITLSNNVSKSIKFIREVI